MATPPPRLSADDQRVFPARLGALEDVQRFIEGFASRSGMPERDTLRLLLIVEELFTNTVVHGYGRDSDQPIDIALRAGNGSVALVYRDAARAYDPLAALPASQARADAAVEERPVGELGVLLVGGLAKHARYAREGEWNCLRLVLETGR